MEKVSGNKYSILGPKTENRNIAFENGKSYGKQNLNSELSSIAKIISCGKTSNFKLMDKTIDKLERISEGVERKQFVETKRPYVQHEPASWVHEKIAKRNKQALASKESTVPDISSSYVRTMWSDKKAKHKAYSLKHDLAQYRIAYALRASTEFKTLDDRLSFYNRKHKCVHKRWFNRIHKLSSGHFAVSCDHELEKVLCESEKLCPSCGYKMRKMDRACPCVVQACIRCGRGEYSGVCFCDHDMTQSYELDYEKLKHDFLRPFVPKDTKLTVAQLLNKSHYVKQSRKDFLNSLKVKQSTVHPESAEYRSKSQTVGLDIHNPFVEKRGVMDSLLATSSKITSKIKNISETAVTKVKDGLEVGKGLVSGLADSICDLIMKVVQSITNLISNVKTAIHISRVLSALKAKLLEIVNVLRSRSTIFAHTIITIIELIADPSRILAWIRLIDFTSVLLGGFSIIGSVVSTIFYKAKTLLTKGFITESSDSIVGILGKFVEKLGGSVASFTNTMMPSLRNFNTIVSAAKNLGTVIKAAFMLLPNFIVSLVASVDGKTFYCRQMRDPESPFHKVAVDIITIKSGTFSREDLIGMRRVAKQHLAACYELLRNDGIPGDMFIVNALKNWTDALNACTVQTAREKEPFCVKVVGAPGVGKSRYWPYLFTAIMEGKTPDAIRKSFYVRDSKNPYWDGVTEDIKGILYDDFGQNRSEEDVQELIALISTATFAPVMASLENKGITLDPEFVVLLSNTVEVDATTVISSGAINRRPHVVLQMTPSDKSSDGLPAYKFSVLKKFDTIIQNNSANLSFYGAIEFLRDTHRQYLESRETNADMEKQFIYRPRENKLGGVPKGPIPNSLSTFKQESKDDVYDEDALTDSLLALDNTSKNAYDPGSNYVRPKLTFGQKVSTWIRDYFYHVKRESNTIVGSFLHKIFGGLDGTISFVEIIKTSFLVLVGAFAGLMIIRSLLKLGQKQVKEESGESSDAVYSRGPRIVKSMRPEVKLTEDIVQATKNNLVRITWLSRNRSVHGFFVSGNIMLTVRHFFEGIEVSEDPEENIIKVEYNGQEYTEYESFNENNLVYFAESAEGARDCCLYQFSPKIRHFRTISHLFWNGKRSIYGDPLELLTMDPENRSIQRYYPECVAENEVLNYDTGYKYHSAFAYKMFPRDGMCGSPIYDLSTRQQGKIVGIHVGYDSSTGESHGMMVTEDDINEMLMEFSKPCPRVPVHSFVKPETKDNKPEIVPFVYGSSTKPLYLPIKTDILPSPIADKVSQHYTEPVFWYYAKFRKEGIPVMENMINKYKGSYSFNEEDLQYVTESIAEDILATSKGKSRRILTMEENLNGIPGEGYFGSLDMSTSPGYPYVLMNKDKKELFDCVDGKWVMKDETRKDFERVEEIYLKGGIPELPYLDYLKDERLPTTKIVNKKKIRVFSACPLMVALVTRKYFLAFVSHFYSMHNKSFSAVGINKGSLEWNSHIDYLMSNSSVGFDGDYTAWDGTVNSDAIRAVASIVNKFYDDAHSSIRETILMGESQSMHMFRDHVYTTDGGVSSGSVLTVVLNTIVNEMYLRMAWLALVPRPMNSMFMYHKNVRTRIYGDDNVVSVKKDYLNEYNALTVGNFLRDYGITYGPADKGSEQVPWKNILETSFLKNGTGTLYGFYVPIMREDAMLEQLNWIRECQDPEAACEMNCNSCLREAFFRGSEYFTTLRKKLLDLKPSYKLVQYIELKDEFLGHGGILDWSNEFGFDKHQPTYSRKNADHMVKGLTKMLEDLSS